MSTYVITDNNDTYASTNQVSSSAWSLSEIIYTALDIAIAVAAIVLNTLVIVIIGRFKALRTITNAFVTSLSAADLLVGVLGIPCAILGNNGIPSDFGGCLLMNTMIVILTQVPVYSICRPGTNNTWRQAANRPRSIKV